MLIGGSDHSLDKKGRMFIPARFKGDFGEKIVICACAFGKKCLWGFTEEGFETFCDKLNKLPYGKMQDIYRFLSNSAVFAEFDASGRFLIPNELRTFAGIENEELFLKLSKITNKVLQAKYELSDDVIDQFGTTCDAEKDYKRAEQQQEYFEHQLEEALKGYNKEQ